MKIFNFRFINLAFACALFFGFFACKGPEGPAGLDGKVGDAIKCQACHGSQDVDLKTAQYEISKHGTGVIWEEESGNISSSGCQTCHTGTGFVQAMDGNIPYSAEGKMTNATGEIKCKTCHTLHKKYDSTDFALRGGTAFKLRYSELTDSTVDFKTGNICARCHQNRPINYTAPGSTSKPIDWTLATFKFPGTFVTGGSSYNRFGPHYGVVANVVAGPGRGLQEITGAGAPVTDFASLASNPHMSDNINCVSCHMGSRTTNNNIGQHTFKLALSFTGTYPSYTDVKATNLQDLTCTPCHTSAKFTATLPLATSNAAMLKELRDTLLKQNVLDLSQTSGTEGYNVLGEYLINRAKGDTLTLTKNQTKAVLNYLMIVKDRSYGVHNPYYVNAILKNSLWAWKQ